MSVFDCRMKQRRDAYALIKRDQEATKQKNKELVKEKNYDN